MKAETLKITNDNPELIVGVDEYTTRKIAAITNANRNTIKNTLKPWWGKTT